METTKDAACCFKQILEAAPTPQKKQLLYGYSHSILQIIQVRWAWYIGHSEWSKGKLISNVLSWNPTHGHTSRTYIHQIWRHCMLSRGLKQEQWPIGTNGERKFVEYVLSACLDDDQCIYSALISLGRAWTHLFSQLEVNRRSRLGSLAWQF